MRVYRFDEPTLVARLGEIGAGGESIAFPSTGRPGGGVLSMRQVSWLVGSLRQRASIPPESDLFVSDRASGRLIPVPIEWTPAGPGRLPTADRPALRYRLECKIFGTNITIYVHEQQTRSALSPPDDPAGKRHSSAERIADLLAKPPSCEYDGLAADLEELTQIVRQEVAVRIAPALKQKIRAIPCDTYSEKQALTKWVNGELRRYGLTVLCRVRKQTDHGPEEIVYPGCLVTDVGNHPKEGRFQLKCRDDEGRLVKPLNTPSLSVLLDHLEVMVDDPDRYHAGKWTDHADRGHAGRLR